MISEHQVKMVASHTSLFCAEEGWSDLTNKVLFPILCGYEGDDGFGYVVHFSTDRGDGIHLTILGKEKNRVKEILSKIRKDTLSFLATSPSKIARQSRLLPMFANFDNNSVHFGIHLFFPRLPNRSSSSYLILWQNVSRILLKQLVKADFSLENLYWLAIQITLSLSLKNEKFRSGLIGNIEKRNETGEIPDVFVRKLHESQPLLHDILNDSIAMNQGVLDEENTFIAEICFEIEAFIHREVFGVPNPEVIYNEVAPLIIIDLRTVLGYNIGNSLLADFFLYNLLQRREMSPIGSLS